MAEQEPYWRGIFQCPSVEDTASASAKGSYLLGPYGPITTGDVASAIKGMSDGAPGPDGRKECGVRNWQPTSMCGCFQVIHHLSSVRGRLSGAESAKEAGTRLPSKHCPITISDITNRCCHKILAWRLNNESALERTPGWRWCS